MSRERSSFRLTPADDGSSPSAGDRLLVAEEVARLLAVPVSWIREATRGGALPHVRLGRYVRYERRSVLAWVVDQRVPIH